MCTILDGHETAAAPSALPRLLAGLLLCAALLLSAASSASALALLDWNDPAVVWPDGSLGPHAFTLSNGIVVTITVTQPGGTSGSFSSTSPREDCALTTLPTACLTTQQFGSLHNLAVLFDPSLGTPIVTSPIIVTVSFSAAVTDLKFEISDIDFATGGTPGVLDHRRDQVVITSNAGSPTLSFKTVGSHTFSISGNTATANCTVSPEPTCNTATDTTAAPSDSGTAVVDFGVLAVTTVTITYNEAGNGSNPASRGIGLLAGLQLTPVELTSFTIE